VKPARVRRFYFIRIVDVILFQFCSGIAAFLLSFFRAQTLNNELIFEGYTIVKLGGIENG